MNAIKNITIGHTERLYKPVGYTMLANLVNIIPFCLSIEAVRIIFAAFDGSGRPLDTARLWCIFGILAVYMLVMALAERASYRANFRGAYEMSASGPVCIFDSKKKFPTFFLDVCKCVIGFVASISNNKSSISFTVTINMSIRALFSFEFRLFCMIVSIYILLHTSYKAFKSITHIYASYF